MQELQQFAVVGAEEGEQIRLSKDYSIYVGMENPTDRIDQKEKCEKKKEGDGQDDKEENGKKENKNVRIEDDRLLLVVTARINGHSVCALIDSGATRCFVTPACVTAIGLKGTTKDILLELENGQKYLSRGFLPDVLVVTIGLTVRLGLTVTNLLHEVDLVLPINWL